ncbi:MAG: 50S ribosomal protein L25 [Buchnera aphidicola (Pentalonia nigronervosa)]|jgi:large subunit ribosomal protein L25|uniref:Large ribosomal subunit protein bL25 n=1 Tax=Buchnera aphidicola (Pentalonia nigronervosa) TaxID=1309793 RepID=A0A7H1AZG4_9GAMM|nr:MAG: 50S ribosomal protein L25 [Buchnera aphidicola (Pentalonia nigronervosa)]
MLIINAEIRLHQGKSFNRKLRINDKMPGILYGKNQPSILLILDHNYIFNIQKQLNFYKKNVFLFIKDEKYTVKVQSIQRRTFQSKLLHIDFVYV